jgi:hypothetical protein
MEASAYRRFTLRSPAEIAGRLSAIGRPVDQPSWRVIVDVVAAYL